jgi:hypothetical protein
MKAARTLAAVIVILSLAGVQAPASVAAPIVRTPDRPIYRVHLTGGTLGHTWAGDETISFRNAAATPLSVIYLRLWSNGVHGCQPNLPIQIANVVGGTAHAPSNGCTVVRVDLTTPVAAGARTQIGMDVRIQVPQANDRFGYWDGLALFGTALPTLAIRDDTGWHLDPFVDLGESFYSLVGDYRVSMRIPAHLDVVTTGIVAHHTLMPNGARHATYVAHDVRDFEWAAGRMRHRVGRAGSTRVVVSYIPHVIPAAAATNALRVATHSLRRLGEAFGTFPYPEMDVVLAPFTTFGGMEYPTLIFTNPDRFTISHELAHQWWYGIVGDDEFHEPWLDESFASWSEFLPYGGWTRCARFRFPSPTARITNDMSYWAAHPGEYYTIYNGGGCMLANLAHRFGYVRFAHLLRRYGSQHWLDIARTSDFQAIVDAAAARRLPGLDMEAFWSRWRVS